jgi:hypothetical protein
VAAVAEKYPQGMITNFLKLALRRELNRKKQQKEPEKLKTNRKIKTNEKQ